MIEYVSQFKDAIEPFESLIFKNEAKFCNKFCKGGEIMDLLNVHFGSESIRIQYVLMSGQHISTEIKLNEFNVWLNEMI